MTTVAYRDGVMAADSGAWLGDAVMPWARKLAVGPDGSLHGASGGSAEVAAYLAWVDGGFFGQRPAPEKTGTADGSFIVLIAKAGDPVKLLTAFGTEIYDAPYFAIGAGNVGALCAMHAGATAEQAIEAAIMHAPGAIGPVRTIAS